MKADEAAELRRPRYAVSSLFLHESFKKLTADPDEQFFFVTGTEVNGVMVLDQWAEFAHQKRSMVGVTADTRSTHKLLIRLEQFGHKLLAHFHSHPGNGADATHPSGIDENSRSGWRVPGTWRSWRFSAVTASYALSAWTRTLKSKSTEKEWKTMLPAFTVSRTSIRLKGKADSRSRRSSAADSRI